MLVAALVTSCGGSSSTPSAAPVTTPAPGAGAAARSLNMALRSQLDLAALGVSAGSGQPFPGSNLIVVSDINGGLFVVEYTGA
jgi:hypothetical protein